MQAANHEAYFATVVPEIRARVEAIRDQVVRLVPDAEPSIAYSMPAFRKGRVFLYFAAFKKHIGIYPPVEAPADLVERLASYRGPKGNLSFPHDTPLPTALIAEVITALAAQYSR